MFRLAALSCLLAVALSVSDEQWMSFKESHGKTYEVEEDLYRRGVFESHVAYIQKHNLEADLGVHTYWLGTNEWADMPNDEFVAVMNGYRSVNRTSPSVHVPSVADLPAAVDWRPKGYVTEIKNQGQCGSCWSFSATGSLEGQHFKKTGKLVSLSEQNLVDCSVKQGNHGCQGGLMDQAFDYIKSNNGIDTEESYPYKARNGKCQFNSANVGATLSSYTDIKHESESDLQNAVATVGPVSVAIDASHSSFQLYRSGVYKPFFCSQTKLDHGVLAVGYGSESGHDYWIVKNSWGPSWGMKGYINMVRNDKNKCGIATQASYPVV